MIDHGPLQGIADGQLPPQSWGGRYFLDNVAGGKSPKASVFVFTPAYKEPRFFYVQMRFALDQGLLAGGTRGQPAIPFSETMVNAGTAIGQVTVTMKRSLTAQAASMDDYYVVSGAPTLAGQTSWFPVMVVPGKKLVITIENTGDLGIWIDCTVAPLSTLTQEQLMAMRWSTASVGPGINARPNVFGFGDVPGTIGNGPTRTPSSIVPVTLLPADPTRRQFWISNESTARLALRFSNHDPDVTAGAESWDVILDPKGPGNFSRYQSPLDAYWGEIRGVWEAVDGFALASSAIYLLQPNDEPL